MHFFTLAFRGSRLIAARCLRVRTTEHWREPSRSLVSLRPDRPGRYRELMEKEQLCLVRLSVQHVMIEAMLRRSQDQHARVDLDSAWRCY